MVKTDNHTVRQAWGRHVVQYNPEWKYEVDHANRGKVGAPYQYSETLIMLTAAVLEGQDWIPQEMGCGGCIFYI